ncbi:methionine synthase [Cutibacterium namnetense]|uniref:methionine synthase n=1 Tax=Cutibacterium namnetense TaxID=1574624 RepID=UPI0007C6AAFC|nr:methionine synthase [Cutibacterium namnetense]TKW73260.1 MAG: methionine synthase [Cutibacterium acnes]
MIATGIGSLPGADMRGSLAAMADTFDQLIPLPELPARGVGAQMIGRTTAVLVDLPVDHGPGGWRLADSTDHTARSARSLLRSDLDDLEEVLADEEARVKISFAGPLTLATGLHLRAGESILADESALVDVATSLAEGMGQLMVELRRRMPKVTWTLQIDEPSAPAVLSGAVATQSGLYRYPAMAGSTAAHLWQTIVAGRGEAEVGMHCCGAPIPWALAQKAGFSTVWCDVTSLLNLHWVGEWMESGGRLGMGVVDTMQVNEVPSVDHLIDRVLWLVRYLKIDPALLRSSLLTPACGLAGWSRHDAAEVCRTVRRAGDLVDEQLERASR